MSDTPFTQFAIDLPEHRRRCEVVVGAGILSSVSSLIGSPTAVAIVHDDALEADHIDPICESLRKSGISFSVVSMSACETNKQLVQVERLLTHFLQEGLDRSCAIIAIGGGIVGDTVGFAAATYLRGVRFINVPTTLLAMIDASIGGKTGVNAVIPSTNQLGKNLIGAFHQPGCVIADVRTLRSLPERVFNAGLAEGIKHGIIGDAALLADFENAQWVGALRSSEPALVEFVARNMRFKASIVERDERESDLRMLLNLGHTFAHAIESLESDAYLHGEAVALGLIAAAGAGVAHGVTPAPLPDRIRQALKNCSLPTRLESRHSISQLSKAMQSDKKRRAGQLRLILPTKIGSCRVFDDVTEQVVEAGWRSVGASN